MLDLAPLIASQNFDLTKLDPKIVDFWKHQGTGSEMIGVPYATYPSFMYVNADLFKEAGLPLPPTKVGDLYQGKPWDMDAVRALGMKLTVDKNGNDATSANFDPANVVQWGFDMQYTDSSIVAESSLFGASSVVADDFKTAQIPDQLATGVKWYNDGVWKDHFIPSANQINSDLLDKGNEFESGNLAMNESHSWFTCCVYPAAPAKPKVKQFGFAIAPSYNGTITAKLHADTFSLLKTTKAPGRGLHGARLPRRIERPADDLRGVPGRSQQAGRLLQGDQRELPGRQARLVRAAGHAQPTRTFPTTSRTCRTTPRRSRPSRPSRTSTGPRPALTSTPSWPR